MRVLPVVLAALAIGKLARSASAEEFVIADEAFTMMGDQDPHTNAHHWFEMSKATPKNWLWPTDYFTTGEIVVRYEVLSKPGRESTAVSICLSGDHGLACATNSGCVRYAEAGLYGCSKAIASIYIVDGTSIDWSNGIHAVTLGLVRGADLGPITGELGPLYYPTKLHVTVTIKGGMPSKSGPPEARDAGRRDRGSDRPGDGRAPDAGPSDAAEETAAPDAGSLPETEMPAPLVGSCTTAPHTPPHGFAWMSVAGLAVFLRRRRCRRRI